MRERADEGWDGVVAEGRDIFGVEAALAARWDERWVQDASDVLFGDEAHRTDDVQRQADDQPRDDHDVADPPDPIGRQHHQQGDDHDGQQQHGGHHVEAQLRPAVRLLVQAQPQRGGGQNDPGQRGEGHGRRNGRPRSVRRQPIRNDDQAASHHRDRHQLEEAAARVGRVRQPGSTHRVEPAKQVCRLERNEYAKQQVHGDHDDHDLGGPETPAHGLAPLAGLGSWRRGGERQCSGGQPGEGDGKRDPPAEIAEIELEAEHVVDDPAEDGVRRCEENHKHQHHRDGDGHAANDRHRVRCAAPDDGAGRKLPNRRCDRLPRARQDPADGRDGKPDDGTDRPRHHGAAAEGGDRRAGQCDSRQDIEGHQRGVGPDRRERGERQRRRREPQVQAAERRPAANAPRPNEKQADEDGEVDSQSDIEKEELAGEPDGAGHDDQASGAAYRGHGRTGRDRCDASLAGHRLSQCSRSMTRRGAPSSVRTPTRTQASFVKPTYQVLCASKSPPRTSAVSASNSGSYALAPL